MIKKLCIGCIIELTFLLLFYEMCVAQDWNGSLADLLRSQPNRFEKVMRNPAKHRLQIIYTQIDRDAENQPQFHSFTFRNNDKEYFYPASTVKLPVALLALEKLNRLQITGLDRDTVMLTGTDGNPQTMATEDKTSTDGLPRISQYVKKILLVSDNDAFNRLYEFVGHDSVNRSLAKKRYNKSRIVHRLSIALGPEANRHTNPIKFVRGDHTVYEQPGAESTWVLKADIPIRIGEGDLIRGKLITGPKNFSSKNCLPLQAMHDVVKNVIFPKQSGDGNFDLSQSDRDFVYRYMSALPREGGIAKYVDPQKYPDAHVKFLLYGGEAKSIPTNIRVFNKVGLAYGFLTDAAYVVDFKNKIEFILAATIYTNANQIFNDGIYEYDEIGLPFLMNLGQAIYELELQRKRIHQPKLNRFEKYRFPANTN